MLLLLFMVVWRVIRCLLLLLLLGERFVQRCVCVVFVLALRSSSSMFQPPAFAIATDKVEREAGSICITQHGATLRQTASNERQPKVVGSSSKSKAKP